MAALDHDAEAVDLEELRDIAEHAARQQLKRGVRRLVGIALGFAVLDFLKQQDDARVILGDLETDAVEFRHYIGAAGLIRHQHLAFVADRFRCDVFVGLRVLDDRGSMNACLGRERIFTDIGRITVRRAVEHFIQRA